MMEIEHDVDEEDLEGMEDGDYASVPALDKYDVEILDERRVKPLSFGVRRAAELAMQARDAREEMKGGRGGAGGAGRGPRALQGVEAGRTGALEISWLAKKLKMGSAIVNKACDLLRKVTTGVRGASTGPEKKMFPACCLEIASKICRRPVNREDLLDHAGFKSREYFRVLAQVHTIAKIPREVSVAELCQEFGVKAISTSARQLLEVFKTQFILALPAERRDHADFSRPTFAACAVMLAAERCKAISKKPDRVEMLRATGVSDDDMRKVYEEMKRVCTMDVISGSAPRAEELPSIAPEHSVAPVASSTAMQKSVAGDEAMQKPQQDKKGSAAAAEKAATGHVLGGSSGEGAAVAACDDVPVFGPALPTKASSVTDAPVFGPDLLPSATSGVADVHSTASSSSSEPPSTPAPRAEANSLSTPCAVANAKDAGSAKATARRPPPPSSRRPLTSAQRLAGMINPLGAGNKRPIESVSGGAAAGGSMSVASDGKAKCAPTAAVVKRQKEEKKAEEIKAKKLEFEEFKAGYLQQKQADRQAELEWGTNDHPMLEEGAAGGGGEPEKAPPASEAAQQSTSAEKGESATTESVSATASAAAPAAVAVDKSSSGGDKKAKVAEEAGEKAKPKTKTLFDFGAVRTSTGKQPAAADDKSKDKEEEEEEEVLQGEGGQKSGGESLGGGRGGGEPLSREGLAAARAAAAEARVSASAATATSEL